MKHDIPSLTAMLRTRRVVALTGAGLSTDSGIPDYRTADGMEHRKPPVQYADFMKSHTRRQRYWARSVAGYSRFAGARANDGHRALAALEASGTLRGVITQNVDGLHGDAGSHRVVELHGALSRVRCVACGGVSSRRDLQQRLLALNPWLGGVIATLGPDGDAELEDDTVACFEVAPCGACGGVLKPDVVFFGENVPKPVVEEAWALFDDAEVLLVVGTSLAVFSGYRFVLRAAEHGVPVAIVNRGVTRGDPHAALKLDAGIGDVLPALAAALGAREGAATKRR